MRPYLQFSRIISMGSKTGSSTESGRKNYTLVCEENRHPNKQVLRDYHKKMTLALIFAGNKKSTFFHLKSEQ